jgi:hypothetical protein
MTPEEFVTAFNQTFGFEFMPTSLDPETRNSVEMMMKERLPIVAQVPFDKLTSAHFAKHIVSHGWFEFFVTVCDELARCLGAERAIVRGTGHSVNSTGKPFNDLLVSFWNGAD